MASGPSQRADQLPTTPGCYLFRDAADKLLYVGKAINLRARVRSYFHLDAAASPRVRLMASRIASIETITTSTEIEALALENVLIKKHHPYYNVRLRDDSTYPFLKLSLDEDYPRLLVVRRRQSDGARYFGPFPDAGAMRATLHLIGRLFPLRKKRTPPFRDRPCLNYDIGRCLAPCQGLVTKTRYEEMVQDVIAFLEGRHRDLGRKLKADMALAAGNLEFERAAKVRDLIQAVDRLMERQLVVGEEDENCDAIGLVAREHGPGGKESAAEREAVELPSDFCLQLFQVREGKVVNRLEFVLSGQAVGGADPSAPAGDPAATVLSAFLAQHYADAEIPPTVLVPVTPEDLPTLEAYLSQQRGTKVRIAVPQRGARRKLLDMAQENALQGADRLAIQEQAERTANPETALAQLAEAIGLDSSPARIEAFDISHVQGTDTVASMVVFTGGLPDKKEYRTFKIKSHDRNDDFASMHEVVTRRYARLLRDGADLPDLILIDGGKGQLKAACTALAELGIADPPIFGLAKRFEEIFLPGREDPILLAEGAPALFLVQRVRDEAHRFAVSFHRRLRGKHMQDSALDAVAGVGATRKRNLLTRIGSVDAMRKLSAAELARRGGIPLSVAEQVQAALAQTPPTAPRSQTRSS